MGELMNDVWSMVRGWFEDPQLRHGMSAVLIILIGFIAARVASRLVLRMFLKRLDAQQQMVSRRIVFYGIVGISLVAALREVGLDLSIFLGAAGIATIAMGFAAQTSASNIISGVFLLGERSFSVGDTIRTATVTGEVLSLDLLSVELRTFDNLFVRVPNELLVKSEITNLSRFPIRRIDISLRIAYGEDLAHVRDVLMAVADANPRCLVDPKPFFATEDFGEFAVLLRFSTWTRREIFLETKNELQTAIQRAFRREGIEEPTQRRALEGREGAAPVLVRWEEASPEADPKEPS